MWLLAHPIKFGQFYKNSIFGRFNEHTPPPPIKVISRRPSLWVHLPCTQLLAEEGERKFLQFTLYTIDKKKLLKTYIFPTSKLLVKASKGPGHWGSRPFFFLQWWGSGKGALGQMPHQYMVLKNALEIENRKLVT